MDSHTITLIESNDINGIISLGINEKSLIYHAASCGHSDLVLALLSLIEDIEWSHLFLCARPHRHLSHVLWREYSKGLHIVRTDIQRRGTRWVGWDTACLTHTAF